MKTLKVMSIIGIVLFGILFFAIMSASDNNEHDAILGAGVFAIIYGISFSIVTLVNTYNKKKTYMSVTHALLTLNELKEKGILTESEYQAKKIDLLRQ